MPTYTPVVIFGWLEHGSNILSDNSLKIKPHGRKLIKGTTKIIDDEGTDVVYGYPCKIIPNNPKVQIDRESRRELSELFEKWRELTGQEEAILGYYPAITGDIEWPSRFIYFT
tara:strand:- start:441 stop:779 length:339 start_codon:yes stop_codon:yes gene_type:complete